jgi:hypothetical protein
MGMSPDVAIQIDTLVMEGFSPQHAERLGVALQSELLRLLEESGVPPGLRTHIPELVLEGGFELQRGMSPEAVGALAARRLYAGWAK